MSRPGLGEPALDPPEPLGVEPCVRCDGTGRQGCCPCSPCGGTGEVAVERDPEPDGTELNVFGLYS